MLTKNRHSWRSDKMFKSLSKRKLAAITLSGIILCVLCVCGFRYCSKVGDNFKDLKSDIASLKDSVENCQQYDVGNTDSIAVHRAEIDLINNAERNLEVYVRSRRFNKKTTIISNTKNVYQENCGHKNETVADDEEDDGDYYYDDDEEEEEDEE